MTSQSLRPLTTPSRRACGLTVSLTAVGLVLAGCAVGPDYKRPSVTTPAVFKEADGWKQAAPSDIVDKGEWWEIFGDPVLNKLETQVEVSNQNLAAAVAAYRESLALLDEQRASLFPTVDLTGSATRSRSSSSGGVVSGGATTSTGTTGSTTTTGATTTTGTTTGSTSTTSGFNSGSRTSNQYTARIGASWDLDVWGRIRREIESARATAQANKADIANAKLSAQIMLAVDYFTLRSDDEQKRLIDQTVKGYADNVRITQNKFAVGVAARSDVLTALTTLKTAQASAVDLLRSRTQMEHAIAVLVGKAPADLTLDLIPWELKVPLVPVSVPTKLLERRPDIAAAERTMASANAQIGVNYAGFFPDLSLTGSDGYTGLARLFSAANNSWSIGANATQTLFDAGATQARVRAARATYDQQVATYRQTVLTAFQQVEDNIAALRVLEAEYDLNVEASQEADEAEKILNNQYIAGTVDYTQVVVAEATALTARRTVIETADSRQTALIDLISALGGGWQSTGQSLAVK
jgi:NodT family efflux transporter outer membrane factor (OMF) lipoprotein